MKRLPLRTALRWAGVALLFATPTFVRYELSDDTGWACYRAGEKAGGCYVEPTLYHSAGRRLGLVADRAPDDEHDPIAPGVPLDAVGSAAPGGDGHIKVKSSNDCWERHGRMHSWCRGAGFRLWEWPVAHHSTSFQASSWQLERATADGLNRFLANEHEASFVVRRPRPIAMWNFLVYAAAVALLCANVRRATKRRTDAWLRAVAAIPPTPKPLTPYRG